MALHVVLVWVSMVVATIVTFMLSSDSGLTNSDLLVGVALLVVLLLLAGVAGRPVMNLLRSVGGLVVWAVTVFTLGTMIAVVLMIWLLHIGDPNELAVAGLLGLPYALITGFFLPDWRAVLVTVVVVAGLIVGGGASTAGPHHDWDDLTGPLTTAYPGELS
jgi:hypothetical protein